MSDEPSIQSSSLFRFENTSWLRHQPRDESRSSVLRLNVTPATELQTSPDDQIERMKQIFTSQTGKTVVDRRYTEGSDFPSKESLTVNQDISQD